MTGRGIAERNAARLQGMVERNAARLQHLGGLPRGAALQARRRAACAHLWQEARPPLTAMPDGRSYLTRQCPRCGAVKLRGRGRVLAGGRS